MNWCFQYMKFQAARTYGQFPRPYFQLTCFIVQVFCYTDSLHKSPVFTSSKQRRWENHLENTKFTFLHVIATNINNITMVKLILHSNGAENSWHWNSLSIFLQVNHSTVVQSQISWSQLCEFSLSIMISTLVCLNIRLGTLKKRKNDLYVNKYPILITLLQFYYF